MPPAYLVAVHPRQVPVQHHDVVAGQGEVAERLVPVVGDVDRHALTAQPGHERASHRLEILNHHHPPDPPWSLPRRIYHCFPHARPPRSPTDLPLPPPR